MKIADLGVEIRITGISEFDLTKTFQCGQCFRWCEDGETAICPAGNTGRKQETYTGVAYGRAAALRRDGDGIIISGTVEDFNNIWRSYFDLDRDYTKIRRQLCVSGFMKKATQFGAGIRILRQEPWEALCSFIISQNNNIPRIKNLINSLCLEYGKAFTFRGRTLHAFPSAETLAALSEDDLSPLRMGYRAGYVIDAAKAVAQGALDLGALALLPPDKARGQLKKLRGVGDKVADCVLLYGLHMTDSFPVDVWIKRALERHCGADFDPSCFSPYAGIAQQYIFHYMRNSPSS